MATPRGIVKNLNINDLGILVATTGSFFSAFTLIQCTYLDIEPQWASTSFRFHKPN